MSGDLAVRVRLAASASTPADMLCELARDKDLVVRAAVALNGNAPEAAEAALAADQDSHVRALLGGRLAALCPDVAEHEQPALYARLSRTLQKLVNDEVSRVRLTVAGVLKDMEAAPRDIILCLARDTELPISEPVLRLSPVLTQDDLLELLSATPSSASAIAGRSGLDPALCDAVAASADTTAIRIMLQNRSANIREGTLDRLIQKSAAHVDWHEPLVQRPVLSARAANTLANIVALHLLETLAARTDLPPGLIADLQGRLQARMQLNGGQDLVQEAPRWPEEDPDEQTARRFAERLQVHGRLNDEALTTTSRLAQKRLMAALLAVAADQPDRVVQRAIMLRSAKALISLLWQGGFSSRHCRSVQVLLCQIPPAAALVSKGGDNYPLRVDEMRWQLEFLTSSEASAQAS